MKPSGWRRPASSLAFAAALIALAGLSIGRPGYVGGAVVSLLVLAWRHDNKAGLWFPLAVLVLIAVTVMLVLFSLLSILHPR